MPSVRTTASAVIRTLTNTTKNWPTAFFGLMAQLIAIEANNILTFMRKVTSTIAATARVLLTIVG